MSGEITKTVTRLNELNIHYMSEERYLQLKENGEINENEFYVTPVSELNNSEYVLRMDEKGVYITKV